MQLPRTVVFFVMYVVLHRRLCCHHSLMASGWVDREGLPFQLAAAQGRALAVEAADSDAALLRCIVGDPFCAPHPGNGVASKRMPNALQLPVWQPWLRLGPSA
ncbi:unnamed protein product [Symbiodinium sp. CCMP2592]|nr:unnamed protein product [Symbiodinium sp. CCMP2592]